MKNFIKGLSVGILLLISFIAGLVFNLNFFNQNHNEENGFSFSQELEISSKLSPDIFISNIKFIANSILKKKENLNNEERAKITNAFNQILARVEKDKLCVGGSYSVEPSSYYETNNTLIKGQKINANFTCTIKKEELELYNVMLNDISAIAEKSGFITMPVAAVNASFSKEILDQDNKNLRDEILKQALQDEQYYSQLTKKTCQINRLDFKDSYTPQPILYKSKEFSTMQTSYNTALPVVDKELRTMSALVYYKCK